MKPKKPVPQVDLVVKRGVGKETPMAKSFFNNPEKPRNQNHDPKDVEIENLKRKLEKQKDILNKAAEVIIKEVNKNKIKKIEEEVYEEGKASKKLRVKKYYGDLIKVTWRDVSNHSTEWMTRYAINEIRPVNSISVGWMIKETPDYIVVAATYSPEKNQYCGMITIPRSSILDVEVMGNIASEKKPPAAGTTEISWNEE